jgi:cobyrinic acid a,c-diamide synthase
MSNWPRLAVGTVQPTADHLPMLWALCEVIRRRGIQPQVFHSQANFRDTVGGDVICGVRARYLDSWLMSPELCGESFVHGAQGSDLAIVAGRYPSAVAAGGGTGTIPSGGSLVDLCEWLDLAALVVVDVAQLTACRLPVLPATASGLLLDGVAPDELAHWATTLESLWGIPVLGALPPGPALKAKLHDCKATVTTPCAVCEQLGDHLAASLRVDRLLQLASRPALPRRASWLFRAGNKLDGLRVAVAYDEAFNHYFPDVLDVLELQGAEVQDFSPLHDDKLPDACDVIYLGGGQLAAFAPELARNSCLPVALRDHVRQGKRIYAEGDGLAYLCQQVQLADAAPYAMAGILPAVAVAQQDQSPPEPVEITLACHHWLGSGGSKLRGYRTGEWDIRRLASLASFVAERDRSLDLVGYHNAAGSRLALNFAAQPQFLQRFASGRRPHVDTIPAR